MLEISQLNIDRIKSLAIELDQLGKTALEKASEAGKLLIDCKTSLAHGQWLPWLEENFTFTDRTARRWMKLSEDIDAGLIKTDTVSNLAEAYRLTTANKPQPIPACPFDMPLPHQRLMLLIDDSVAIAAFEPIDETYIHVTFIDSGEFVGGTKRAIRRDRAWQFLMSASALAWESAVPAYVPWDADKSNGTRNPNLRGPDPISWVPDAIA